jgi:glycosyltransferase involved in cell wall biosynthesis
MRVVLFCRHYVEYVFRYAQGLRKHCRVVVVIDAKGRSPMTYQTELTTKWGVETWSFGLGLGAGRLASMLRVACNIVRFRPTVVHCQEGPDPVTPLVMLLLRVGRRLVLTVHDPVPHSGRDSNLRPRATALTKLGRGLADSWVVHGAYCVEQLQGNASGMKRNIVCSIHGVLMTEAAALPAEPTTFLFFGRMEAYKGLDVFSSALEILAARGTQCRADIAGSGSELDRLMLKLQSIAGVRVINRYIDDAEAIDMFGRAACVVLPYKDATQSGVVAAAFGAGRPVIASAVGGIPDVVIDGYNGLLIPPSDPVALADAMEKIISVPSLLGKLTAGAAATASGLLNWDRIAAAMASSYSTLHRDVARVAE